MSIVRFKHYPASKSFNNFVDDFFPQIPSLFRDDFAPGYRHTAPVNIKQNDGGYDVEIVAPGFTKEDFKIKLENNLLTISAEQKAEEENNNQNQIRREYKYQSFKRSFTLDENIDTEKIEAKYENGVLTLNLYNKAKVKAPVKQITIQ
jgi:HSP20 family protein